MRDFFFGHFYPTFVIFSIWKREKKGTRKNKKPHDINKAIHYLERWSKEEGTTVQRQAAKYGYAEEYKQMIANEENEGKVCTESDLPRQVQS